VDSRQENLLDGDLEEKIWPQLEPESLQDEAECNCTDCHQSSIIYETAPTFVIYEDFIQDVWDSFYLTIETDSRFLTETISVDKLGSWLAENINVDLLTLRFRTALTETINIYLGLDSC
jgi:hypothetical protein